MGNRIWQRMDFKPSSRSSKYLHAAPEVERLHPLQRIPPRRGWGKVSHDLSDRTLGENYLRGQAMLLEIVFVGQCEVFVYF